jgi:hypothetical protein
MGTPLPCETGTSSGGAGKLDRTTAPHQSTQAPADAGCSGKQKHPRCSTALLEWDHHLGPLYPHQTSGPGSCKGRLPANMKGVPPQGQFLQTQTSANWTSVTLFLFLTLSTTCLGHTNPHQPFNLTWMIVDVSTGDILNQTSKVTPPSTWFPELYFDLRALFTGRGQWDLRQSYFYVCPAPQPNHKKKCGGIADYYCKSWGCESSGDIWWPPPKQGDLIQLSRVSQSGITYHQPRPINKGCPTPPNCNPIMINFTDLGKKVTNWELGKSWGVRLYKINHPGALFTLRRVRQPVSTLTIGPNLVLRPDPVLKPGLSEAKLVPRTTPRTPQNTTPNDS